MYIEARVGPTVLATEVTNVFFFFFDEMAAPDLKALAAAGFVSARVAVVVCMLFFY